MSEGYWPQPSIQRNQFIVDFDEKRSTCRKFDLSGIPCPHAISAIWFNKEQTEAYVDDYYTVDTERKIYKESINPINGENSRLASDYKSLPPQFQTRQPGIPKIKRIKEADEAKKSQQTEKNWTYNDMFKMQTIRSQ